MLVQVSTITTDIMPEPDASGTYDLLASSHGNAYTFTLTKSSTAGSSSCEAVVTVVASEPFATCKPAVTLPAGSDCAAHISSANLQALVQAPGFSPAVGFGGTVSLDITPASDGTQRHCLPCPLEHQSKPANNCSCQALQQGFSNCCGMLPACGLLPRLKRKGETLVLSGVSALRKS